MSIGNKRPGKKRKRETKGDEIGKRKEQDVRVFMFYNAISQIYSTY